MVQMKCCWFQFIQKYSYLAKSWPWTVRMPIFGDTFYSHKSIIFGPIHSCETALLYALLSWPCSPFCRAFLAQTFFGCLNQKSASHVICEFHIYIDSESFRQIHFKKCRWSRDFGDWQLAKMAFWDMAIFVFFRG